MANEELLSWRLSQTQGALLWEPDHELRWLERAEVLALTGDLAGAVDACSQGIARQPGYPRLYEARSAYAGALGQTEEAAADAALARMLRRKEEADREH